MLNGRPLRFPIDYDEGVYFGAAGLLARGSLPYRDWVFVHPPGWPILLAPFAGPVAAVIGVDRALAAAFVAITLVGAATIVLVWRLGTRVAGPVAGLVAAGLYATHPMAVAAERGTFLEPALDLLVVGGALLWLAPEDEVRRRWRTVLAGVLLGSACLVKTWGGFAVAAALASVPLESRGAARRHLGRLALGGGAIVVLVLGPFLVLAPRDLVRDVVGFQLFRAPDGAGLTDRVRLILEPLFLRNRAQLWASARAVSATGAILGAGAALLRAWRRDGRAERFLLVLVAVTVGAFLLGRSFYAQYLAYLAVPETLLAGYAAGFAWQLLGRRPLHLLRPLLALALLATPILPARQSVLAGRARTDEVEELARLIRREVPPGDCLFAFEPAWALAAGRLPPRGDGRPVVADPFATMLLPTATADQEYESIGPAFERPASQRTIRRLLDRCNWVVYGGRGPAQLSDASERWFAARFERRAVVPGPAGLDLWERRR